MPEFASTSFAKAGANIISNLGYTNKNRKKGNCFLSIGDLCKMNLIIDAGNTLIKLAVFDKEDIVFEAVAPYDIEDSNEQSLTNTIKTIFKEFPTVNWAMVSSVGHLTKKDLSSLTDLCEVHMLDQNSKVPFTNAYKTPKSLGVDRIALATAAFYKNANKNSLVIDAGTCITFDLIDEKGTYWGGAISPGIQMRYEALHNQTSKLPLLQKEEPEDIIGDTTESSIHSGVVNGVCQEIDGIIGQYESRYADLTVNLTGGDAQFLSKRLKNGIFADSKFIMMGLNHLLEYNKH